MKKQLATAILSVSILSGCSSIVSQSEYPVSIQSTPDGASFTITNKAGLNVHEGVTPETVILGASSGYFAGEEYILTMNKGGYAEKSYTLRSSLDGWYLGNIIFGGLIGLLIVDPATGAMYSLPDSVDVSLSQEVAQDKNKSLTITSINTLTNKQKAQLIPVE